MSLRAGLAGLLCLGVTLALGWAVLERPQPAENLPERVAGAMPDSGVEHAVTAVLLNFRSYDTLLEIAVLLLAVVVALALREAQPDRPEPMGLENPLLRAVMAWLLPLILVVAGFLLWAGSYQPGGAFQAGSVLAAAGVLLRLAGVTTAWLDNAALMRTGLALGLLTFLGIGVVVMAPGVPFLAYPPEYAGTLILVIELTLTLSIGLTLISLFRLTPPYADDPDDARSDREARP
ncbi:Na+/H+ antiporter MnhB subunit-related protein [Thioalkalivibrio nitratireducens DSM 14787]|uniref:Na+/H+ antiporter MnhB subunit-related protein n=1 Tax=Thioalkalivibrio nitratireducens (strain DSM 14787 / UNIQEM 213 / ALEN2) TaxID=1255043 RepID=L0DS19_THIND|nr:Na+/H+ antiporter MnhB subunit-related protein [Thioalkalivibrio nitratireducens DSM 14787]